MIVSIEPVFRRPKKTDFSTVRLTCSEKGGAKSAWSMKRLLPTEKITSGGFNRPSCSSEMFHCQPERWLGLVSRRNSPPPPTTTASKLSLM